ncbi:MAG: MoaD/ThiS family protein [Actinomycetota bacterium]|nr:MoaD/ThiS family protein [Actinomycetota bacterium]
MRSASTAPSASQVSAGAHVTVRYWAAARAAAAVASEEVCGSSVADVLAAAQKRHEQEPRFAQVLSVCSLLLGERPLGTSDLAQVEVAEGDVLDVLPPFAGG